MLLSERVYCVATAFKMTKQVDQQICVKFWVKLEHSAMETIQMIQKVAAIGDWWLAASSQQCTHSCITSPAVSWQTSNDPGHSTPLQPRFCALQLLPFPETKITIERKEISDCRLDSGKYNRAADDDWEDCVRSQGAYFEGDWGVIVLYKVSCILYILQ